MMRTRQPTTTLEDQRIPVRVMASGLLGVLGMSDHEWERAGERGELPGGESEVASPAEQRDGVSPARRPDDEREELG